MIAISARYIFIYTICPFCSMVIAETAQALVHTQRLTKRCRGDIGAVNRVNLMVRPGDPRGLARIGAMVETPAFYPYLSGRNNLRVLARYCQVPDEQVDRVLDTMDLTARGHDRFATYSLGMKQRLGVVTALLKDPELLILDEPANGLDPAGMVSLAAA
jgi:ABC-type Na+ transport system ATPase subunit NatA